ncbi:MAG: hypothetical protein LBB14_03265, partial [Puniceicoccales bacterium]|nr:hypothetical protein [Puniceicoccales bacterium]
TGSITNCSFIKNKITTYNFACYGGAICCNGIFTGEVSNSIFSENSAVPILPNKKHGYGGAFRCGEKFLGDITNSVFIKNSAQNGGGISVGNVFSGKNDGFADLGGTFFLKNEAKNFGGAIYCNGSVKMAALSGDVVFQENLFNNGQPCGCILLTQKKT